MAARSVMGGSIMAVRIMGGARNVMRREIVMAGIAALGRRADHCGPVAAAKRDRAGNDGAGELRLLRRPSDIADERSTDLDRVEREAPERSQR